MTHNDNSSIDFETLAKLDALGPSGIMRPSGVKANQLGFTAIDRADIDPVFDPVLDIGTFVERRYGTAGINPSAVDQVWPQGELSLKGLMQVAQNSTWKSSPSKWG